MFIPSLLFIFTGFILFVSNWILEKRFDWKGYYISEYIHSHHRVLTLFAFILCGLGVLFSTNIFTKQKDFIEIVLFIYGILFILLGIFPVDKRGKITFVGVLHTVIAHLCFNSFAFSFLIDININNSYAPLYMILLIFISFLSAVLILLSNQKYRGLFQRFVIFSQITLVVILLFDGKLLGNGI